MKKPQLTAQLILCTLLSSAALAVDGVLEINQACALNGGCFNGDTAGYPVTIDGSAGRSYKLTGDIGGDIGLTTNVIEISANDITINLAGFRIVCTTDDPVIAFCSDLDSGSGSGIIVDDVGLRTGVEIRNGSVVGMGVNGLQLGPNSIVHNLRVSRCNASGILVSHGSIVSGNAVYNNGNVGIGAGNGATVSGNTAYDNGSSGIVVGSGTTVSDNTAYDNGSSGITAVSCCGGGGGGSTFQRNTVRNNVRFGLEMGDFDAYRENVITNNSFGTVGGGFNMGDNFCNTNDTCP